MNEVIRPVPVACYSCGAMTRPRVTPRKERGKIIQEAKWICPRCGNPFRVGIVKDDSSTTFP